MSVLDVVAQPRLDQHDDAIVACFVAVREPDVVDLDAAEHLDAVVPTLVGEVGQAALPLDEEIGSEQGREARVIALIPGRLHVAEQLLGRAAHPLCSETVIVLAGLRSGELNLPHALPDAPATQG